MTKERNIHKDMELLKEFFFFSVKIFTPTFLSFMWKFLLIRLGKKEQKCLCFSPESRFLFVVLTCFVNASDGSCKKIKMQRAKPNAAPFPDKRVFCSTDLSPRTLNFNFALQMKRTRNVSETTAWLLILPRAIIWCQHIQLFSCLVSKEEKNFLFFASLDLAYHLVWILYSNYKNNFPSKGKYTPPHTHTHTHTMEK